MSLNIVFSFAFSALFASLGWMPHGGLALALSVSTALEMSALFILMRRRLKGLDSMNIGRGLLQAGLATLVMSAFILGWLHFASGLFSVDHRASWNRRRRNRLCRNHVYVTRS